MGNDTNDMNEEEILTDSIQSALKVKFLATSEELSLYAGAIYSAIMWGRGIDEKNKAIQERDELVK